MISCMYFREPSLVAHLTHDPCLRHENGHHDDFKTRKFDSNMALPNTNLHQSTSKASSCATVVRADSCGADAPRESPLERMKIAAAAYKTTQNTVVAAPLTEKTLLRHQLRLCSNDACPPGPEAAQRPDNDLGRFSSLPWHCAGDYSACREVAI
jgi:hypothetical protein